MAGCLCHSPVIFSRTEFAGRKALRTSALPLRQFHQVSRAIRAPTQCRRRPLVSAAAGSAAFDTPSQQEVRRKAAARITTQVPKPAQLPPPPKSTSLWHVLPYLTKLALSDAQLYWRLGLAFVLMIASKAAGYNLLSASAWSTSAWYNELVTTQA